MDSKNENSAVIRFDDYYMFIYLNTRMSKEDALKSASSAWNRGLTKYEALDEIRRGNHNEN